MDDFGRSGLHDGGAKRLGAQIDAVFACPFHVTCRSRIHPDHPDRKPNAGMLLQAAAVGDRSDAPWIAGDRAST